MDTLDYKTRAKAVFDFLYSEPDGALRRYRVPEYLGDDQLRAEINDIAADITAEIPIYFAREHLRQLFSEIRRLIRARHGSQGWPPAKTFIAATRDAVTKMNALQAKERVQGNAEKQKADELSILATKMIEGLSVPEPALWGPQAVAMMKRSLIDTATLEGYRKSAYEKRVIAYGREKAARWCTERQAWHAKALQT